MVNHIDRCHLARDTSLTKTSGARTVDLKRKWEIESEERTAPLPVEVFACTFSMVTKFCNFWLEKV